MSSLSQLHKVKNVNAPYLVDAAVGVAGYCEILFSEPVFSDASGIGWTIDDNVRFDYQFEFDSYQAPNLIRFKLTDDDLFWNNRTWFFTYDSGTGSIYDYSIHGKENKLAAFPDPEQIIEIGASINEAAGSAPSLLFKGAAWDTDHVCEMTVINDGIGLTNSRSTITYSQKADLSVVEHSSGNAAWEGARWDGTTPYSDDANGVFLNPLPYMLAIPGATNYCLPSRNLTAPDWNLSGSMTATYDQVGLTGAANTATLLTSSYANSTLYMVYYYVSALSNWLATFWIKRINGTGDIQASIYQYNGTPSYQSLGLSSTLDVWQKVSITASVAYPRISIKIVTSGDSIVIGNINLTITYAGQTEEVKWPPIFTTTAAVTRNADAFVLSNFSATVGSFGMDTKLVQGTNQYIVGAGTGWFYYHGINDTFVLTDGTNTAQSAAAVPDECAVFAAYSNTSMGISVNGVQYTGTFDGNMNWTGVLMSTPTRMNRIRRVAVWDVANAQISKDRIFLFP